MLRFKEGVEKSLGGNASETVATTGIEVGEMSAEQFEQYVSSLPAIETEKISEILSGMINRMVEKMDLEAKA